MLDLFDSYDAIGEAASQLSQQADAARAVGDGAVGSEGGATTNSYGGGWTNERIPQEQWEALYDGGVIYDGGGAFNNTMTGYAFEWVPVTNGAALMAGDGASTQSNDPPTVVDEIVVTGKKIGFENTIARLIAQMTPSIADDFVINIGGTLTRPGPHAYVVMDQVGDSQCDADEAWEGLLLHAAPGQTSTAVQGGTVTVPGLGPVIQEVNAATKTVTNITTPDHVLYPGTVERSVVVEGNKVFIRTVGVGTGPMAGLNVLGASTLWGAQDSLIAQYVDANDNGPGDC
jgi:hypothetical protein